MVSNSVNVIEDILNLHFIELFRCQPFQSRYLCIALWNRIIRILLKQLEEHSFSVEVTDRVVKAKLDFSSIMLFFVSVYIIRLFVIGENYAAV